MPEPSTARNRRRQRSSSSGTSMADPQQQGFAPSERFAAGGRSGQEDSSSGPPPAELLPPQSSSTRRRRDGQRRRPRKRKSHGASPARFPPQGRSPAGHGRSPVGHQSGSPTMRSRSPASRDQSPERYAADGPCIVGQIVDESAGFLPAGYESDLSAELGDVFDPFLFDRVEDVSSGQEKESRIPALARPVARRERPPSAALGRPPTPSIVAIPEVEGARAAPVAEEERPPRKDTATMTIDQPIVALPTGWSPVSYTHLTLPTKRIV